MKFDECVQFFKTRDLPLKFSLADDGTKVVESIEYDPKTNCIVGLVAPNDKNGLPIKDYFKASTPAQLQKFCADYNKASYILAIMVQSLQVGKSSFMHIKSIQNSIK